MNVEGLLAAEGYQGWVHAVDVDTGREVGHGADELVVPASVFKLPVLVEYVRLAAAGELDPRERVLLRAGERETLGGTGYAVTLDDVEVSLRDLVLSMMSVSDNRATDVVIARVGGVGRINATSAALGFPRTVMIGDCNALWRSIAEDLVVDDVAGVPFTRPDPELAARIRGMRALDPARTTRTTPRETTGLLTRIWRDDGLTPDAAAEARRVLGLQVWTQRIGSGFDEPDVAIAAKSGTLSLRRCEAGVVEYPDGGRYAVAVFLATDSFGARNARADRTIGALARAAVDALRSAA